MLIDKLNPERFSGMSGKMAAIVGYILGERMTEPAIVEMVITSDGFVLARQEGDCGMNEFLGSAGCLHRNWHGLLNSAGLSPQERAKACELYSQRICDHRGGGR
jgi:hypothetical protein